MLARPTEASNQANLETLRVNPRDTLRAEQGSHGFMSAFGVKADVSAIHERYASGAVAATSSVDS